MKAIHRIEKFFSLIGYISNVLGKIVLFLIIGHFLIGIYVKLFVQNIPDNKDHVQSISGDERETLPVYDDYPDNGEFWIEHKKTWSTHFEPYYHWRRGGFQGKYTNVSEEGVRHSLTLGNDEDAKKIFVFGGSTLWGTGSKDEHTIPSFLQSKLGEDYKVYNYGESGYVSTQELNFLLHQLAKGNIPDAVIFYDGANDGYAGVYSPAIPRDVQNLRMRDKTKNNVFVMLYKASNYKMFGDYVSKNRSTTQWDDNISSRIQSNSSSVVALYEAHIKQVKALGKEYGFKTFFFWQPNLFSRTRDGFPYEEAIIQKASPVFVESQRQVYLDAKAIFINRENEQIFFLGDLFNQIKEPIYIDWCHIGPNGNERVARRMFDTIRDLL